MTRRQYTPEMKIQIVKEALETGNAPIIARRHDISPSLVGRWVTTWGFSAASHPYLWLMSVGYDRIEIICSPGFCRAGSAGFWG